MNTLYGIIFEDRIVTIEKNRLIGHLAKESNTPENVFLENPVLVKQHIILFTNKIVRESQNTFIGFAQWNYESV